MIRLRLADYWEMVRARDLSDPEEACGLLIGTYGPGEPFVVQRLTVEENRAPARLHAFEIDVHRLRDEAHFAESMGQVLLGGWHSHPGGLAGLSGSDVGLTPPVEPFAHLVITADRLAGFVVLAPRTYVALPVEILA